MLWVDIQHAQVAAGLKNGESDGNSIDLRDESLFLSATANPSVDVHFIRCPGGHLLKCVIAPGYDTHGTAKDINQRIGVVRSERANANCCGIGHAMLAR